MVKGRALGKGGRSLKRKVGLFSLVLAELPRDLSVATAVDCVCQLGGGDLEEREEREARRCEF